MDRTTGMLVMFCPSSRGGLAEYNHCQALALSAAGVQVIVLAAPDYLDARPVPYLVERVVPRRPGGEAGLKRRIRHAWWLVKSPWILAFHVARRRPKAVLFSSFAEYLSPFWVWPHMLCRGLLRVRYGTILHDPVRDFKVGPKWWHALSVQLAYAMLDFVVVHQEEIRGARIPRRLAVFCAPHGLFELSSLKETGDSLRSRIGISAGQKILLAFGFIRDNKNLDLLIKALPKFPSVTLLVAGAVQSESQRPLSFYADLAAEQGVVQRCKFVEDFIPEGEVGAYFDLADWVAVTYSASFHSQSGVLNLAARARKPLLASSGHSPLEEAVKRFRLGEFLEPDSLEAVIQGLARLIEAPPVPDWEGYEQGASWRANAAIVMEAANIDACLSPVLKVG